MGTSKDFFTLDEKYRALVQTTPDTIIIVDEANTIIFCNRNIARTFGHESEELIGKSMSILVPEELREAHLRGLKRYLDSGIPKLIGKTVEVVGLRKDGSRFPMELSLSTWHEGKKIYFSSIIRDITERKREQQELELLLSLTDEAHAAESFEAAIGVALKKMCEMSRWDFGEAWIFDKDYERLVYSAAWYSSPLNLRQFADQSKTYTFNENEDLPGRIFGNETVWLEDISKAPADLNKRARLAGAYGLKSCFGVPITFNNKVLAALIFYHEDIKKEDTRLEKVMSSLASQLGSVLHSKKTGEELHQAYQKLKESNEELSATEELLKEANMELEERVRLRTLQVTEIAQQFKFLADSIPHIVWTARPDGTFDYFNDKWRKYAGIVPGLTFEQNWGKIIHPDDLECTRKAWEQSVVTGEPFEVEYRLKKSPEDAYRWHLAKAVSMINEYGHVLKWFGTSTDIHDYKLAEEGLKKKNEELYKINSDLDNFVYTASHDLKAPVLNLEGLINFLEKVINRQDTRQQEKVLEMIKGSVQKFKLTIKELTDISRIQKNMEEDIDLVNFNELVEEFYSTHREQLNTFGANIVTDFQVETVEFSKKNLRSIIFNLLSNAIKYRSVERKPQVVISTEITENNELLLSVRDNGLGIPNDQMDKIFTMFKRLHDHVEGSGVGLYIVKRIVENAGGRIVVESQLNEGTVFKIYLKRLL
jgi:PAS domain S-box-containing protein